MAENEMINGWTFEETVKTAENLMGDEKSMFKWDVLRHLRDFAEMYKEEIQQYKEIGTVEELRIAREKQIPKKPIKTFDDEVVSYWCSCPMCLKGICWSTNNIKEHNYCTNCGQELDWSDEE